MKKTLLLFLFLCFILLCTACHGSRTSFAFEIPDNFDDTKEYKITFWAKNDTNKAQVDIYNQAITDFRKLYPNITIELRLYTDYGKIYNDVITNISTGTTPNVCITYPDHIATYLSGDHTVVPLDELMTDSQYGLGGSELRFQSPTVDQIITKYANECKINGRSYALPFMRSTEICYVNKTMVEALGYTLPDVLTWDFVWDVSEAATKKSTDGTFLCNGQKVMLPFIYKSTDNMMISYLKQQNAGYSTSAGQVELFNDTTRDFLYTIGEHTKTGAFNTFKIAGYPANFLNAGQCIFAVDSSAGATWMGSEAPLSDISEEKKINFEIAVRTIPQVDCTNIKMISQGPSVCIFNKSDPEEVLASWLFAQYLLSNEVQIAYSKTEGYIPVTTLAQDSAEYLDYLSKAGLDSSEHYSVKIEASELLLSHVDDTFVTPVYNGSASLRDAAGQIIENTVKSVRRKAEINDDYFDGMFAEVTSLYRLDQRSVTGKVYLGPLPLFSVLLLCGLCAGWIILAILFILSAKRKSSK